MFSPDIQIFIPCHSLDDIPTELADRDAASLLNAFAIAFHPVLLAWTGEFPRWRRADDPPPPHSRQLVIIPTVCDGWLPHHWIEDAKAAGATVVSGLFDRTEMIESALLAVAIEANQDEANNGNGDVQKTTPSSHANLPKLPADTIDLESDFCALGTCWLLVELLTRKMRQFSNIDESRFFQRAQSAAKAALANDRVTAETHLRACFEMLLEARERFYPVDCYLLDLCIAATDVSSDRLLSESQQSVPLNLLISGDDLKVICGRINGLSHALKEGWQAGRIGFVGGEDKESPLSLLPLESLLRHFERGRSQWQDLVGTRPHVWGQRQFGLSALLPQLLVKNGYHSALHLALDDGIYPDVEHSKLRWRGVDGTLIDSLSRIPLAAESASSYLRFPERMAESMDHDQVAGLVLARWPQVNTPWFEDLRRSQKYAACLGRFVTFDFFFDQTELPGQLSTYKPGEYFTPSLIQHVARGEANPISRYSLHSELRRRFEAARWCLATAAILSSRMADLTSFDAIEEKIETIDMATPSNDVKDVIPELVEIEQAVAAELSKLIVDSKLNQNGILFMNPLSFTRRVVVKLPELAGPLPIAGPIKASEFDVKHPDRSSCVVEIPGSGFAWVPLGTEGAQPVAPKIPLAQGWLLRNDQFEIAINERTGGIAHVRYHNQRTKRFSQQLSFRFPRERIVSFGSHSDDSIKTQYAEMRCLGHEVAFSGSAQGEVISFGEIFDQAKEEKLASFRQTVRVWRSIPTIEIEIELTDVKVPEGDPWNNYFTSRFAWNDPEAVISRGIYHSAHGIRGERFETSDFIEVASEDERLTIVPHGLPFHRKTGDRMLDSLLVVAGESKRRFRFTIAIDSQYPLEVAWNATTPISMFKTRSAPPHSMMKGWFFHIDARNVQLTRVINIADGENDRSESGNERQSSDRTAPAIVVRLLETEGISKPVKLQFFGQPICARKRKFQGETICELSIENGAVIVDMTAYEIVDVEIRFS